MKNINLLWILIIVPSFIFSQETTEENHVLPVKVIQESKINQNNEDELLEKYYEERSKMNIREIEIPELKTTVVREEINLNTSEKMTEPTVVNKEITSDVPEYIEESALKIISEVIKVTLEPKAEKKSKPKD